MPLDSGKKYLHKKSNHFERGVRFVGVLGSPIAHSLSPVVHNHAFQELSVNVFYLPIRVGPDELGVVLGSLTRLHCLGVNLTVPLKEKAFEFLDRIDEEARKIGAINCVAVIGGKTVGYNTDAKAFGGALHQEGVSCQGKNALVFGAGGAARAVLYQMGVMGARKVIVCNRHLKRSQNLVNSFRGLFPNVEFSSLLWDKKEVSHLTKQTDLFVNTTSIGVTEHQSKLPLQINKIHKKSFFFDLNYGPACLIERSGAFRSCDGLEMFIRQAALSFSLWTGINPPFSLMRKSAQKYLSLRGQI